MMNNLDSKNGPPLSGLVRKWRIFFLDLPPPYKSLDLNQVTIRWNTRMRSRAGSCRPWEGIVELNPHLLDKKNGDALESVLVHELCHLAVGYRWPTSQPHGRKWKGLMKICGFRPERCHSLTPVKRHLHRRWALYCKCKEHKVTTLIYNRVSRGIRYQCVECRGPLDKEISTSSKTKPRGFFSRIFS